MAADTRSRTKEERRNQLLYLETFADVFYYVYAYGFSKKMGSRFLYALWGFPGKQANTASKVLWVITFLLGGIVLRPLMALLKLFTEVPVALLFLAFRKLAEKCLASSNPILKGLGGLSAFIAGIFFVAHVLLSSLFSPVDAIKRAYAFGAEKGGRVLGVTLGFLSLLLSVALMSAAFIVAVPALIGVVAQMPGGLLPAVNMIESLASWVNTASLSGLYSFLTSFVQLLMPIITESAMGSIVLYGVSALLAVFGINLLKSAVTKEVTEPSAVSDSVSPNSSSVTQVAVGLGKGNPFPTTSPATAAQMAHYGRRGYTMGSVVSSSSVATAAAANQYGDRGQFSFASRTGAAGRRGGHDSGHSELPRTGSQVSLASSSGSSRT